jgi:hypothetical protein
MEFFKVGDRVVVTKPDSYKIGQTGTVAGLSVENGYTVAVVNMDNGSVGERWYFTSIKMIKQGNSMANMTLVQKMKLALKSEPEKTFQKVGITDEKDELTADGTVLFHNWLFEKSKAEFNTTVAQPLLAEQEAEKK